MTFHCGNIVRYFKRFCITLLLLGVTGLSTWGWAAPQVSLRPVSDIGSNTATLVGQVEGIAARLEAWFEYGTMTPLIKTPVIELGSGVLPTAISRYLSILQCGQNYQYRLVVSSEGQLYSSPVSSFNTRDCGVNTIAAELATTEAATDITPDTARLQATVDPNRLTTRYYFEYGQTDQLDLSTPLLNIGDGNIPLKKNWQVSGLVCNADYYFRVVAFRDDGTVEGQAQYGEVLSFTTEPCPLLIRDISIDWVGAEWATVSVAMQSLGVLTDVQIFYGLVSNSRLNFHTDVISLSNGLAIFQVGRLVCGNDYRFQVLLQRDNLDTVSDMQFFSTASCNTPPVVTTLVPSDIQATVATFRARVTPNSDVTDVYFEYGDSSGTVQNSARSSLPASSFERVVSVKTTGLSCETVYQVKVLAEGNHGFVEGLPSSFTTASCFAGNANEASVLNVAAGGGHSLVTNSGGQIYSWGDHERGQLGSHDTDNILAAGIRSANGKPIVRVAEIAAGVRHSLALSSDGRVLAWGDNSFGQLGDGSAISRVEPEYVVDANYNPISNVIAIAAGEFHSLALLDSGEVLAWGGNEHGQLGINSKETGFYPVKVFTITNAVGIDAGHLFSVARLANGQLQAWGDNRKGQLGVGSSKIEFLLPSSVSMPSGVAQVAAGGEHIIAIDTTNNVFVWGSNETMQLTEAVGASINSPYNITSQLPQDVFTRATAGAGFSALLRSSGEVLIWGDNSHGQIGQNSATRRYGSPVAVKNLFGQNALSGILNLDAGDYHMVAINNKAEVIVWGDNSLGQLNLSAAQSLYPVVLQNNGLPLSLSGVQVVADRYALTIEEGAQSRFNVWLSAEPQESVRVQIGIQQQAMNITLSQSELLFTSSNWNTPQLVTVLAEHDSDAVNGEGRISLEAPGVSARQLDINENDVGGDTFVPRRTAAISCILYLLLGCLILSGREKLYVKV